MVRVIDINVLSKNLKLIKTSIAFYIILRIPENTILNFTRIYYTSFFIIYVSKLFKVLTHNFQTDNYLVINNYCIKNTKPEFIKLKI